MGACAMVRNSAISVDSTDVFPAKITNVVSRQVEAQGASHGQNIFTVQFPCFLVRTIAGAIAV